VRIERDQINTAALLGVLALVFLLALWWPDRLRDQRLRERVASAQQVIRDAGHASERLTEVARAVEQLQSLADASVGHVPTDLHLANLLRALGGLLEDHDAAEQTIRTRPIKRGVDFHVIPVSIQTRIDGGKLGPLLAELRALPRLVRVTRLEVANREPADSTIRLQLELCAFAAAGLEQTGGRLERPAERPTREARRSQAAARAEGGRS